MRPPLIVRLGQVATILWFGLNSLTTAAGADLKDSFRTPPEAARPWVYWYFMDGNLTREGMTADLEAMKRAGIGGMIFLEVDIGVPRGPVKFMSPPWRELFRHAVSEADRLGLEIALGAGPGWCGTGGPWVKPERSMQHLVASQTNVTGPLHFDAELPKPSPRKPFFGEGTLTPELARQWREFYREEAVLAFPTPTGTRRLNDVDEKALYFRAPYSSQPGVKAFLPAPADFPKTPANECIASSATIDLTGRLQADGRLNWEVPPGNWTIMRFGRTITGQTTRPAPLPGLGFESDKFDPRALDEHFDSFAGILLRELGSQRHPGRGLTTLHFDSWEMSSQNWSERFRQEFTQRRGYDPLRFLPAMSGQIVDSEEISERFLWDLRQTAQELVVENHAQHLKTLGKRHGLQLSIEPYDLNPTSDLTLGGVADVPMCEFWYRGFDTFYSVIEAASVAHTQGRPIVAAESFTSEPGEDWLGYPGSIKNLGDWAFCSGVNRIVFHRYQHQPWLDRRPGMRMGPYGVHWERTQTWWDLVPAYHQYLARCQYLLRRGLPVADILYLAPEGAPHVFRPPASALQRNPPDRKGYNFDGIAPDRLLKAAQVRDGRIIFADGMSYSVLVLPEFDTMTPQLLGKIRSLVEQGATIIGAPPKKSPSLTGFPGCDTQVQALARELWGETGNASSTVPRRLGKGRVFLEQKTPDVLAQASPVENAKWIWHNEGNPAASAPVGSRYFQRDIVLDHSQTIVSARWSLTADNSFVAKVNGQKVGEGNNFHRVEVLDITAALKPGTNRLNVLAQNDGPGPNPAGWIGTVLLKFADGSTQEIVSDRTWLSGTDPETTMTPALELGTAKMDPWKLGTSSSPSPDIYPDYAQVAAILNADGVIPDFSSTAPLRSIHRREEKSHYYFVANASSEPVRGDCRFRVTGLQPELWDPVTGTDRPLPGYRQESGAVVIPLEFAAHQSYFVIFRQRAATRTADSANFPKVLSTFPLVGDWEVRFDPAWGGPERVIFPQLVDWTARPESGIRHYSGKATYRKSFSVPKLLTQSSLRLDLGKVNVMAAVKINGHELGTAWCAPWQVEVPAKLLKPEGNQLEIVVANLWPNRLIADAGLAPEQRLTWTTSNPYKPNSPLLPSGLLGPVTLVEYAR